MKKGFLTVSLILTVFLGSYAQSSETPNQKTADVAWVRVSMKVVDIAWQEGNDKSFYNEPNAFLKITAIDGNAVNYNGGEIFSISSGVHEIETTLVMKKKEYNSKTIKFRFGSNKYYYVSANASYPEPVRRGFKLPEIYGKVNIETIDFEDVTEPVIHGNGSLFDIFFAAEKKAKGNFLGNGIARIRAQDKKKFYNYGVYDITTPAKNLVTLEINSGIIVDTFNDKEVAWEGPALVRIPAGKNTLMLDANYIPNRSGADFFMVLLGVAGGLTGYSGAAQLGMVSVDAAATGVRNSAAKAKTDDIKLVYDFYAEANYELKPVNDKTRKGKFYTAQIIPGRGAPKEQKKDVGTSIKPLETETNSTGTTVASKTAAYSVLVNGEPTGPYTVNELKTLAQKRQLTADTFVWKEGMPQWAKVGTIKELESVLSAVPPPAPPQR